jgi:multiple sugar transport system permease protein
MKKWFFWHGFIMKKKIKKWIRKDTAVAWIFLAPSIAGFALFYLIPFVMGLFYSFMNSTVDSHFVGLENYRELLASDSFRKAASNTFYFSAVSVPLILALSLGLAMLLNKNIYLRKWLRTAYVLPLVVPVHTTH